MRFFLNEGSLKMTTFQMLLLGILSSKEPTHYTFSDIDAVTSNFPSFDKYIFPQSKTCLALVLSAAICAVRRLTESGKLSRWIGRWLVKGNSVLAVLLAKLSMEEKSSGESPALEPRHAKRKRRQEQPEIAPQEDGGSSRSWRGSQRRL